MKPPHYLSALRINKAQNIAITHVGGIRAIRRNGNSCAPWFTAKHHVSIGGYYINCRYCFSVTAVGKRAIVENAHTVVGNRRLPRALDVANIYNPFLAKDYKLAVVTPSVSPFPRNQIFTV
jgi:hypothetical protein